MKWLKNRKIIFIILATTSLGIILDGSIYNIAHLDNYLDVPHSFFRDNEVTIGYLILVISPLALKRYVWTLILIAVAAAFEIWVALSR